MFGGAYDDARMLNWPHWHRTPLPGIAITDLHWDKAGGGVWKKIVIWRTIQNLISHKKSYIVVVTKKPPMCQIMRFSL